MPLPKPYAQFGRDRHTLRFFLGDSVDLMSRLAPASVDVVVTSPPYNLGIQYRSYDDGQPRDAYLTWSGLWLEAVGRTLAAKGSLFLNLGAKPTDPWTALDVAQVARRHTLLEPSTPAKIQTI